MADSNDTPFPPSTAFTSHRPQNTGKNYTNLQFLFMQIFVLTGFKRKLRFKSAEPPKNILT